MKCVFLRSYQLIPVFNVRLSRLQKLILVQCYETKGRLKKKSLDDWYANHCISRGSLYHDSQTVITKTIEKLIDNGFVVGFGERTPHKWYIHEIRLTAVGRKSAKKFRGIQQQLPLK